jgi:hypothetical protein
MSRRVVLVPMDLCKIRKRREACARLLGETVPNGLEGQGGEGLNSTGEAGYAISA